MHKKVVANINEITNTLSGQDYKLIADLLYKIREAINTDQIEYLKKYMVIKDKKIALIVMSTLINEIKAAGLDNTFLYDFLEVFVGDLIDKSIHDDKDFMLFAVSYFAEFLNYASPRLKDDKEVILAAIQAPDGDRYIKEFASERMRNDQDVVIKACYRKSREWLYRLPEDRPSPSSIEEIMNIISKGTSNRQFQLSAYDMKPIKDKKIALAVMEKMINEMRLSKHADDAYHRPGLDHFVEWFIDESLYDDKDVMLYAISHFYTGAFRSLVSERLQTDPDIIREYESQIKGDKAAWENYCQWAGIDY